MNLNMNLSLKDVKLNPKQLVALLRRAQTLVVGIVLIALFAYTALVVQRAINVKASDVTPVPVTVYNQTTIDQLKSATAVDSSTPASGIGESSPFGQ